jgi:pimeloyl-ACP methyl ester carboxylesterase
MPPLKKTVTGWVQKTIRKAIHKNIKKMDGTVRILNGVFGDTLEKKKTGFEMKTTFYFAGEPLTMTKEGLEKVAAAGGGKICILAHGSCGSEKGWEFPEDLSQNYGSLLEKDFCFTPVFLRYNSGLHISTNGKRLSALLEEFVRHYPKKITQIVLVGHSMGGLVFRSACHYGQEENKKWVKLVRKVFYLGSPHLGTHLEKLGKLAVTILKQIPNPIVRSIVLLGDLRSAGVKDLRHGYLTDEDWQKEKSDRLFYRHKNKTPLLKNADHYLICGTISKVAGSRMGKLFGDGLVHPASGTGKGLLKSSAIPFLEEHCKIIPGVSHSRLQRSQEVYDQIKVWVWAK